MEGMPFRLMISAIVAGLTIPALVTGVEALEASQISLQVERGIDRIVRSAQDFYVSGGGSEAIRVEFPNGITAHLAYVRIGDAEGGPRAPSAAYRVGGGPEVFLLSDPQVPMAGPSGPLIVGPGSSTIRVSYEGEGPVRLAVM